MTVNLSAIQFERGNLYQAVLSALEESGLAPERLELEVTEGVLLRDEAKTHEVLHNLRALGVRISLDDFGTAYASLSYLRSFPFDKIKIDRSFVRYTLTLRNATIVWPSSRPSRASHNKCR